MHIASIVNILIMLCQKCKINEVQIWNDCGDYCLSCWVDVTYPEIDASH
jgi:hypothetical protein